MRTKYKPITDINDPRGYEDPSPDNEYPEMMDEVYDDLFQSGVKPEDLPQEEDRVAYINWLAAHPNGLE